MNKHINFEDNIFVLNIRIRVIADSLILDTDPELFLEKTMDDADFININLGILLGSLIENERLIERDEQFHNLFETERQFAEILSELEFGQGSISGSRFPVICDRIAQIRENTIQRRKTIEDFISKTSKTPIDPMVVSSDELSELLKAF
ncbi:MAG: hypothetical protein LBJ24_01905 [Treponema sp.]|jgi:hypothetical protein|nr:hypothetical protein [Treponema sp.]